MDKINIVQGTCSPVADYSTVTTGNRILPFVFELDLAASNLNPSHGQKQRFCYNIIAVGHDNRTYADLSHFVLGICPDILENQLSNVTVTIDGESKKVTIGNNVKIFNPPKSDPPTHCPGLKFDFGLDKVTGSMTVCFELNKIYPIGLNALCLYGASETKKGLSICGPICNGHEDPVRNVYVPASICADVTVTPYVESCEPIVYCCGPNVIHPSPSTCPGVKNGVIKFTVSQDICLEIPLKFGADTVVGDPFVQGGTPTNEDVCTGCTPVTSENEIQDI